ncbi:MAG: CarD family transcriptional regulator [Clostridia bacterium]|nr:CarD family transcriptional regulator [Clostridia bacterium]
MPEKDSYVVYGDNGVCHITDICSETMFNKTRTYYILKPVNTPGSIIHVPADNETLLARMRMIPDKNEILKLIDDLKEERIPWEKNNRLRSEIFSDILNRGNQKEMLVLIRTIWEKRKNLAAENKKLGASDDSALKKAEKTINEEFGFVLSVEPKDVPSFIAARLSKTD